MRYLFGFICVLALGVMGCSETSGTGGSGGEGGSGGITECQSPEDCDDDNECTDDTCLAGVCEFMPVPDPTGPDEPGDLPGEGTTCGYYSGTCEGGSCVGTFACTEAGIREASAAGAGPHNFDCDGPTTIVTEAEIVIEANSDVILEGGGDLTVDGDDDHRVFSVAQGATVELQGFTVTGGAARGDAPGEGLGGGIANNGTLTLVDCTISENSSDSVSGGIHNIGILTVRGSTISGNTAVNAGGGVGNGGTMNLSNSTISGNTAGEAGGILNIGGFDDGGVLTMTNCTMSGNTGGGSAFEGITTLTGTVVNDGCFASSRDDVSNGYNIESPGDTCGFDQATDQVNVSADDLKLGELADNGGPTETHRLAEESAAVDVIPGEDCVVAECVPNGEGGLDCETDLLSTDQRGEPRFVGLPFGPFEPVGDGCDVGAFELEP